MAEIFRFTTAFQKPLTYADFDTKELRKGFRRIGKTVKKLARANVAKKLVSKADEYPGKVSGGLSRGIKASPSRTGFSVTIWQGDVPGAGVFYPAFVYYGHRGPGTETAWERKHHEKRSGKKVAAPRKNWIEGAALSYGRTRYAADMAEILDAAIKPGIVGEGL